jgi:hypothetical protein
MNLDIFKVPDPSGRMSKESFLLKNNPEEYRYIIDYCESNNLAEISFKEKVYLTINNLDKVPICKNINCFEKVKFKNSTLGYLDYCSNKCISCDPDIKNKKIKKSLEKFGTKTPAESPLIKNKIIKTNLQKYGANSPMCLKQTQDKSKQTLFENWGVDNPSRSEEIINKRIESFKKSSFKESYRKISIEKYGVEHPWMDKKIHSKTIECFYSDYKSRINSSIDKKKYKFIQFKKDISTSLIFHCFICNTDFDILTYQFYYRKNNNLSLCTKCFPISENASISQIEVYNFIKENYNGEMISDCKNIIKPFEIDIYLPELKIGFEFNGVWWHSDKFKQKNYHLNKNQISDTKDIKLYSIWEDDWNIKNDICKSFILNKIGKTTDKIYARKCQLKEVDYLSSKKFLDENHLQGDCKSSCRIGLYNKDELVSLMTFSKLRLPLQRLEKNRNINKHFELTRFCNKINTIVVGGASRILNFFINKYLPLQIETYSDNLISDGNLYKKLGFKYIHTSNPGYWYVIDNIRHHRFNWRKQKLIKMGYDVNKTEEEIMNELGHYRVYNSGNKKWILTL